MLELVNRDRGEHGLESVEHDAAAERAAQRHAEDMARHGFTAHWGSDGSVPEERYTAADGAHFVQENAACFFDGVTRELDRQALFLPSELEKIERAFVSETPPNDGHRKNILKSTHTALGIGLAQPKGLPQPCMTQEFVDRHGEYEALPRRAPVGKVVRVAGSVAGPVEFGGVGVSRIDPARPLSAAELNATSSYAVPEPYVVYFPKGYRTPAPVRVDGDEFRIDVELSDRGRAGRYGVSVWGRHPGAGKELGMISLRVVGVP